MMKPFIVLFIVLCVMVVSISSAHAGESEIRFAFQDRIGSVIPIIAVRKGYFKEEGLNVRPLTFSSGPACAEALYSGAADIGAMGDTTAIITVSRTERFKIIGSHATGQHRHRVMVKKGSGYNTLADLKGKKLAVKKGTSTYGGLLAALKRQGVSAAEIQFIDLSPSVMTEALAAGSIDAFAASEPTPSLAEGRSCRQLATLGGFGNEYPIMLLADKSLLAKRPADLTKFLKALKKAEKFAAEHPVQVAELMSEATGIPFGSVKRAIGLHQYNLRLDDGIINSLTDTAYFLKIEKIIQKFPDFDSFADSYYLRQAE